MRQVCRTCLEDIADSNYIPLKNDVASTQIKMQLSVCIPEMVIDSVINPVLCRFCVDSLHSAYKFKYQCLRTEEQIKYYIQSNKLGSKRVMLCKVLNNLRLPSVTELNTVLSGSLNDTVYDEWLEPLKNDIDDVLQNTPNQDAMFEDEGEDKDVGMIEDGVQSIPIVERSNDELVNSLCGNEVDHTDNAGEKSTMLQNNTVARNCLVKLTLLPSGKIKIIEKLRIATSENKATKHNLNVSNTQKKYFVCNICKYTSEDGHLLARHKLEHNTEDLNNLLNDKQQDQPEIFSRRNEAENMIEAQDTTVNAEDEIIDSNEKLENNPVNELTEQCAPDVNKNPRNSISKGLQNNDTLRQCCVKLPKLSNDIIYSKFNHLKFKSALIENAAWNCKSLPKNYHNKSTKQTETSLKIEALKNIRNGKNNSVIVQSEVNTQNCFVNLIRLPNNIIYDKLKTAEKDKLILLKKKKDKNYRNGSRVMKKCAKFKKSDAVMEDRNENVTQNVNYENDAQNLNRENNAQNLSNGNDAQNMYNENCAQNMDHEKNLHRNSTVLQNERAALNCCVKLIRLSDNIIYDKINTLKRRS